MPGHSRERPLDMSTPITAFSPPTGDVNPVEAPRRSPFQESVERLLEIPAEIAANSTDRNATDRLRLERNKILARLADDRLRGRLPKGKLGYGLNPEDPLSLRITLEVAKGQSKRPFYVHVNSLEPIRDLDPLRRLYSLARATSEGAVGRETSGQAQDPTLTEAFQAPRTEQSPEKP